jgi:hypothetical protein
MRTITRQLRDAWQNSGTSLADLLARSNLDLSQSSLSRKLAGRSPMTTAEAEALARALDVVLAWAA